MPNRRAYDSLNPQVVEAQINRAKSMGIDGFVVDWYGPASGLLNDVDRKYMDDATAILRDAAQQAGFTFALMYDEGTLRDAGVLDVEFQAVAQADLLYAEKNYFGSPAYLPLQDAPALFVFPYPEVDPWLDWSLLRNALTAPVTLIDQDPNPADAGHDANFDGFFAWVQPSSTGWDPNGLEWGEAYLQWFYATMTNTYSNKLMVGGVWPGFDDRLAPWGGQGRFMSRQGTHVWDETWQLAELAEEASKLTVLISTWNDFEEGTDVEFGVDMVVDMETPVAYPEILIRSSPVQVWWDCARGDLTLQVYSNGKVIYEANHPPGVFLALASSDRDSATAHAYEVKVWDGTTPLSKTIKIRSQDPRVVPITP